MTEPEDRKTRPGLAGCLAILVGFPSVGAIIAIILHWHLNWPLGWTLFYAELMSLLIGALGGLVWLVEGGVQESQHVHEELERLKANVFCVPMQEAAQQALALLSDPQKFECVPGYGTSDKHFGSMGEELRNFFTRYSEVRHLGGLFYLRSDDICPSQISEGFLRIGTDSDHSEVAIRHGRDTITVLWDDDPLQEETYPSIWHYVLMEDRWYDSALRNRKAPEKKP